jgi:hypothetical protein
MLKKKKLHLAKLTVANLSPETQKNVKAGAATYLSDCCTVNMRTCIFWQTECLRWDTYQAGGGACQ